MSNLLPKRFFKENPLKELSAAQIAYFSMTAAFEEAVNQLIYGIAQEEIEPQRLERIQREQEEIAQMQDAEAIVRMMRSGYDITNRRQLCMKALEHQDALMPMVLRRLESSFQDTYVETAVFVLAHAKMPHIETLKTVYENIRNPYAQSMACLVFAVQKADDMVPLLCEEYHRMKRAYPTETFAQGPLLALHILHGRA